MKTKKLSFKEFSGVMYRSEMRKKQNKFGAPATSGSEEDYTYRRNHHRRQKIIGVIVSKFIQRNEPVSSALVNQL